MHIPNLEPARPADLPAIAALVNLAYRGSGEGTRSWNVERDYIYGDRTSVALIEADLAAHPEGHLCVWREGAALVASVWLQPLGEGVWYLGSLAVDPGLQNGGYGRRMLDACEAWVEEQGGRTVRMTVVHLRETLIAWYLRRGYRLTGETEPWPEGDDRFGVPLRALHFVVLEKSLPD